MQQITVWPNYKRTLLQLLITKLESMSYKPKISNREVNKTLKHIEQIQKKVPHPKDVAPQPPYPMIVEPSAIKNQAAQQQLIAPSTPDVQPWLEETQANSQTMKKQQTIRRQINFMLGFDQDDKKEAQIQIQKADAKKIAKKLQKYQPANSSFSLYLSEIKGLQRLKRQNSDEKHFKPDFKLKDLNLPQIQMPSSGKRPGNMTSRLKSIDRKRAISLNNVSYIGQIKQIYTLGETVSEFPGQMIEKIDRATKAIGSKFQQLNNKTIEMTADVGTYHLQQQTDRNYKNNLLMIPRWMVKKRL